MSTRSLFDQARLSRQYTPSSLEATSGVIKRKIACMTCRKARAKCDVQDFTEPCTRCMKKGVKCEPALAGRDFNIDKSNAPAHAPGGREVQKEPTNFFGSYPSANNLWQGESKAFPGWLGEQNSSGQCSSMATNPIFAPPLFSDYHEVLDTHQNLPRDTQRDLPQATTAVLGPDSVGGGQHPPSFNEDWLKSRASGDSIPSHCSSESDADMTL